MFLWAKAKAKEKERKRARVIKLAQFAKGLGPSVRGNFGTEGGAGAGVSCGSRFFGCIVTVSKCIICCLEFSSLATRCLVTPTNLPSRSLCSKNDC